MAPPTSFNPDAATHLALLNDWMDSSLPLCALADRYQTTIAELCFFFVRPEIAAQLSLLHAAAYNRARLAATAHLDSALSAIALLVRKFLAQQASPDPTLTPEQHRRAEETGRRAATILLRFIKNRPAGFNHNQSAPSPALAGEVSRAQLGGQVTEGVPSHATEEAPPTSPTHNPASSPPSSPPSDPQRTSAQPPRTSACASSPISSTDLAQTALQALAEFQRPGAPIPAPPSAPSPSPLSEPPRYPREPLRAPFSETSNIPRPTSDIPAATGPPTRAAA